MSEEIKFIDTPGLSDDLLSYAVENASEKNQEILLSLSKRGISLNKCQANMLLTDGRRTGKTFFAMVCIAEASKITGIHLDCNSSEIERLDKDANSTERKKLFIKEFQNFLFEHYQDVYKDIKLVSTNEKLTLSAKVK